MPGPPPKDPAVRQRRNKSATRAELQAEKAPITKRPDLHFRGKENPWHANTKAWWVEIWASPMSSKWLHADVWGLRALAELWDAYWRDPTKELLAEIRMQEQRFGLSPIDRKRLDWRIRDANSDAEEQQEATPRRRMTRLRTPAADGADPRRVLELVKSS